MSIRLALIGVANGRLSTARMGTLTLRMIRARRRIAAWFTAMTGLLLGMARRWGEDLHEVAVRVAEVGTAAAVHVGIDLAGLAAGGIGVVRDTPVSDPAEGGLELLVAQL